MGTNWKVGEEGEWKKKLGRKAGQEQRDNKMGKIIVNKNYLLIVNFILF